MTTLQQIRGVYEQVVIDAAGDVDVYAENQEVGDFDAANEYCLVRVNFGEMQETNIGCEALEFIRGSLVCEIYTPKGQGPGRGLEIAQPIMQALSGIATLSPPPSPDFVVRVGAINGPRQAALTDRPHHFTRFSCPIYARVVEPGQSSAPILQPAGPACLCIVESETPPENTSVLWLDTSGA